MKKIIPAIIILLIITVILVFAVTPVRVALFGLSPEYKFEPDAKIVYNLKTDLKMNVVMENLPKALEKNFPIRNMETTVTQDLSVKADKPEGNLTPVNFTVRVEDATLSLNGKSADEMIPLGQENTYKTKIAPTGKIIAPQDKTEMNVLSSTLILSVLQPLPEKSVKPGDQWTRETTIETKPGFGKLKLSGKMAYTFDKLEKYKNDLVMQVKIKGDLVPALSSKGPISIKGKTGITGYYLFDIKAGKIVKSSITMKFDNHVNLQSALGRLLEKASSFKISPKATMTLEMERK